MKGRTTLTAQAGVTMIEMLVSLVAGLVVTGGVVSVYLAITANSVGTLNQMKLDQQVARVLTIMVNDTRRAGYWGNQTPAMFFTPAANPFSQPDLTSLEVHNANAQVAANSAPGGDCILYAYDLDDDGVLDDGDITGFRLANGVIQMRISGDTAANARHDACSDADDTWANLTDPDLVDITQLNFSLGASECLNSREPDGIDNDGANGVDDDAEIDCYTVPTAVGSGDITIETREVALAITGSLVNSPDDVIRVNQDVRVRNDVVRVW